MLAPALRRHVARRPLENLEQRLLHAFAGHVTGDRNVLRLAADLVDFVDVDDAALGLLHIVVRRLQQPQDDVLDIFAHVPGLGERRGIRNRKRNIQDLRQGPGEQGLAGAGRADEQDVAFLDIDLAELGRDRRRILRLSGIEHQPFEVIVDRDREDLLGVILPDDVVVEGLLDLRGFDEPEGRLRVDRRRLHLPIDDRLADVDAGVADVHPRPGDDLLNFGLRFTAERAKGHARGFSHGERLAFRKGESSRERLQKLRKSRLLTETDARTGSMLQAEWRAHRPARVSNREPSSDRAAWGHAAPPQAAVWTTVCASRVDATT